jgi:hypothetical protein
MLGTKFCHPLKLLLVQNRTTSNTNFQGCSIVFCGLVCFKPHKWQFALIAAVGRQMQHFVATSAWFVNGMEFE